MAFSQDLKYDVESKSVIITSTNETFSIKDKKQLEYAYFERADWFKMVEGVVESSLTAQ